MTQIYTQKQMRKHLKNNMEKRKKLNILKIAAVAAALLFMALICLAIVLIIQKHGLDTVTDGLSDFVKSLGIWGLLFMFLLQVAQVIFAIIPGEPLELCAGLLYGTVGGTLFCLSGILCGTFIIFLIVKTLGKPLVDKVIGSEKYDRLKFLKDPAKRDIFVFILMFIPGTPKDVLTYFSPLTGMGMIRFLIISTVARIPSVISSTYVGDSVAEGKYLLSLVVFAIVGIVSLGGILIYNKILDAKNKNPNEEMCKNDK